MYPPRGFRSFGPVRGLIYGGSDYAKHANDEMLKLAMPVFLPIVLALGFDPIWFGILFCVNMQVSFLSPPFGPAAFYLKSVEIGRASCRERV